MKFLPPYVSFWTKFALVCLLAGGLVGFSDGQQAIPARKLTPPPTIDGELQESEWDSAATVSGAVDVTTLQRSPYACRFWLGYDERFVYFAAKFEDPQPKLIHATEYATNVSLSSDDYFEVDLDVSGSNSDFSQFRVNPRGATSIYLTGGRAAKREWLGEIQAAGKITETGWQAEMRVPWKIMRLPGSGLRDLRVNFTRYLARLNRGFAYVYTQGANVNENPIWKSVELPKPSVEHNLKLLPYSYVGYDPDLHGVFNGGLDLKTELAKEVQLVGSINPDFRNIENQILSLDFSRFPRIPGESRPFFLEGSQYIGSSLFASQMIPRFSAGVNTYGKIDDRTSFGLIEADDIAHQNSLVANATHYLDPFSDLRLGITSLSRPGEDNNAYLARYERQMGSWYLFARDMGSQDRAEGFGRQSDLDIDYNRKGLDLYGGYVASAPNFDPKLGFFQEQDYKGWLGSAEYDRTADHGLLNDWGVHYDSTVYVRSDNSFYRRQANASVNATDRRGFNGALAVYEADFEGSHDHTYSAQGIFPRGDIYRNLTLNYTWGQFSDISYNSLTVSSAYRPSKQLQLNGRYQVVEYGGSLEQFILSGNYDLGSDRSIAGRAVVQDHKTNFYLAYRRSGNKGMEYYLILGDPNALTFRSSLILKVTVPIQL